MFNGFNNKKFKNLELNFKKGSVAYEAAHHPHMIIT